MDRGTDATRRVTRIGRPGIGARLKTLGAGTLLMAGIAAALAGIFADDGEFQRVFIAWFGIGMLLVLITQFVLIEGSCPGCGMDDDDDLVAVAGFELGVTGAELKGKSLLECKRCDALIVLDKKSREAQVVEPADLPTATQFDVELPGEFVWPERAVCCGVPAAVQVNLEHESSSATGIAAHVAGGILGGALGRGLVGAAVGPTGTQLALAGVPACSAHADDLKLHMAGKRVMLRLPTLAGRQAFFAANPRADRAESAD
jgi:hypothetical protein